MDNIKLELAPPYQSRDTVSESKARVTFSADFLNQYEALKFFADLQALVLRYQPEHES